MIMLNPNKCGFLHRIPKRLYLILIVFDRDDVKRSNVMSRKERRKSGSGESAVPNVINFVCRYDLKFNHARVYDDRKKKMKAGYAKHKNRISPCDGISPRRFFLSLAF
jgi:hypothetical protein